MFAFGANVTLVSTQPLAVGVPNVTGRHCFFVRFEGAVLPQVSAEPRQLGKSGSPPFSSQTSILNQRQRDEIASGRLFSRRRWCVRGILCKPPEGGVGGRVWRRGSWDRSVQRRWSKHQR